MLISIPKMMKKLMLALFMFLSVEANESVPESQEILTPWNSERIRWAMGCNSHFLPDSNAVGRRIGNYSFFDEYLKSLQGFVCQGGADRLREEFFPQIEVSFKVSDNQIIYLSSVKADLDDLLSYYNLSTICAIIHALPGEKNGVAQLDGDKRKAFLSDLKSVLYDMHHASCSDISAPDMRVGKGEEHPLYVVIQKPGCSSVRIFIWEHTVGHTPYYLGFDMACASVDRLKSGFGDAKESYSTCMDIYKKVEKANQMHDPVLEELSFTEFYLAVKGLYPYANQVSYLTTKGCIDAIQFYTIKDIEKMLHDDQW